MDHQLWEKRHFCEKVLSVPHCLLVTLWVGVQPSIDVYPEKHSKCKLVKKQEEQTISCERKDRLTTTTDAQNSQRLTGLTGLMNYGKQWVVIEMVNGHLRFPRDRPSRWQPVLGSTVQRQGTTTASWTCSSSEWVPSRPPTCTGSFSGRRGVSQTGNRNMWETERGKYTTGSRQWLRAAVHLYMGFCNAPWKIS